MTRNDDWGRFSRRAVLSGAATGLLSGCLSFQQTDGSGDQTERSTTTSDAPTSTTDQETTEGPADIPAPSGEWPQYRGDAQHSGYADSSLGSSFRQVEILHSFGDSIKGITVGDPYLYVQLQARLLAFDVESRSVEWEVESGHTGEPVYHDGTIYTLAGDNGLAPTAMDAETGDVLWSRPRHEVSGDGFVFTPDGNLLAPGQDAAWLLDPDDGSTIWQSEGSLGGFPVVTGNRAVGAPHNGTTVTGVDLETGEEVWTEDVGVRIPHRITGGDARVFVGSFGGEGNQDVLVALSAATGEREWTVEGDNHAMQPPAVFEDRVVVGGSEDFRSHDVDTGEVVWETNFDLARPTAEPVVAGEHVVTGYYLLDRETGDTEWTLQNIRIESVQAISLADGVAFGGTYAGILFALV